MAGYKPECKTPHVAFQLLSHVGGLWSAEDLRDASSPCPHRATNTHWKMVEKLTRLRNAVDSENVSIPSHGRQNSCIAPLHNRIRPSSPYGTAKGPETSFPLGTLVLGSAKCHQRQRVKTTSPANGALIVGNADSFAKVNNTLIHTLWALGFCTCW